MFSKIKLQHSAVVLIFLSTGYWINSCKTGNNNESSSTSVSSIEKPERFVLKNIGPEVNDWQIKFFHCDRTDGDVGDINRASCKLNQNVETHKAIIRWKVESSTSDKKSDCSSNISDWTTEKIDLKLAGSNDPNNHYWRSYASGKIKIEPILFERCMKKNPQTGKYEFWGQSKNGGKVSQECLNTDFLGPKRVVACLYEINADGSAGKLIESGWGLPDANAAIAKFKKPSNESGEALHLAHGSEGFDASQIEDIDEVYNYAMKCGEKVGFMKPFDCTDDNYFKTIPVTRDGKPLPSMNAPVTNRSKVKEYYSPCDKPAYLGLGQDGQCTPYSRLGRIPMYVSPDPNETRVRRDVDAVVVCRRYNAVDRLEDGKFHPREKDTPLHEDIAVIVHNRQTGDTCFFQALSGFQPDKASLATHRVSPPHEKELPANDPTLVSAKTGRKAVPAKQLWIKPTDSRNFACASCHDSDPFMHSPHVDQVSFEYPTDPKHPLYRDGVKGHDFMVPCDPAKPGQAPAAKCKLTDGKGKYSLVSKFNRPPYWPEIHSIAPKDPSEKACVSCHRIGSEGARIEWVIDSLGGNIVVEDERTSFSKSFPESYWMPYIYPNNKNAYLAKIHSGLEPAVWEYPTIHTVNQKATWDAQYDAAGKSLKTCLIDYDTLSLAKKTFERDPNNTSAKQALDNAQTKFDSKCESSKITDATYGDMQTAFEPAPLSAKTISKAEMFVNLNPITATVSGEVQYAELDLRIKHEKIHELVVDLVYVKDSSSTELVRVNVFDGANLTPEEINRYELTDILDSKDFAWKYSPTVVNKEFQKIVEAPSGGKWRLEIKDTFQGANRGELQLARLLLTHNSTMRN